MTNKSGVDAGEGARQGPIRHLLTTSDFRNKSMIERLCLRAQTLKEQRSEHRLAPTLSGRAIGLVFEKHSTRTRLSFEAGIALLGGSPLVINARDTQLDRGEPLKDTARILGGYLDAVVARVHQQSTLEVFAEEAGVPIVNGLSEFDHPCQALTDYFTVFERREDPSALVWAYVGDGNNMAHAYLQLAGLCQMTLRIACPDGFLPDGDVVQRAKDAGATITITESPVEAVAGAQVILTDVWTSMGQEDETKRRLEAFAGYQLNAALLSDAAPDHLVLHCLPAHRGEEITDDVIEGEHSVIFEQAANRLPAQLAILEWLLRIPETV